MDKISVMLTKKQLQRLAFELDDQCARFPSRAAAITELLHIIIASLRRFDKPDWEKRIEAAALSGTSQTQGN